jgi:hypothetical protein
MQGRNTVSRTRCVAFVRVALLVLASCLLSSPAWALKAGLCNYTCNAPGGIPTQINGGGANTSNVQAPEFVLIFWDDGTGTHPWSSNVVSKTQAMAQFLSVTNGPYQAALTQYGYNTTYGNKGWIGRFRMAPYAYTWVGATPDGKYFSSFAKADLNGIVSQSVANGTIPIESTSQWIIYVILVPSGVHATDCGAGCNDGPQFDPNNNRPWERIFLPADNGFGPTLTHEMVEAVTNYAGVGFCGVGGTGNGNVTCTTNSDCAGLSQYNSTCVGGYCTYYNCTVNNSCTQGGNGAYFGWGIADLCCSNELQNGIYLEAYYSVADSATSATCVIPESWQGFQVNLDHGAGWTPPSGAPSTLLQLYGGGSGVLATDTSGNAWFYNSSGGGWGQTGSAAGAQMAVGGPSASSVEVAWTDPGDAANGPYACGPTDGASSCSNGNPTLSAPPDTVTGIIVTNSGYVVATGKSGNVFIHSKSKNAWYTINGSHKFDHIVTMSYGDIIGLDSSRQYVYDYSGTNLSNWYNNGACSGCTWTQQDYAGQTNWYDPLMLVGSPDALLWGAVWASNSNGTFLMYAPYGSSFIENQYFGGEYVATNAHNAFGTHLWFQWMTPSYNGGYTENELFATTGAVFNGKTSWSPTSGTGGRLIGGNNLYATTCTTATLPNCVNF